MNSSQLVQVLKALFPTAMQGVDYTIAVDGSGNATILTWNNTLGTQPLTAALTTELAAQQLLAAQQTQEATLSAASLAAQYAPVSYMSTTFACSAQQLQLVQDCIVQGSTPQGLPSGFAFYDNELNAVSMTLTQLQGLYNAMFAQLYPPYVTLSTLVAEVYAATTIAAVQAIVWS